MIMARNNATPISFWLSQSLPGLMLWIKTNNRISQKQ